MLGNRKLVLDCVGLSSAERTELEADAAKHGFLPGGLDKLSRPLAGEALHITEELQVALTYAHLGSVTDGANVTWENKVAAYAWHWMRERIDVWEPDPHIWAEYDPRWMMFMDRWEFDGVGL